MEKDRTAMGMDLFCLGLLFTHSDNVKSIERTINIYVLYKIGIYIDLEREKIENLLE